MNLYERQEVSLFMKENIAKQENDSNHFFFIYS